MASSLKLFLTAALALSVTALGMGCDDVDDADGGIEADASDVGPTDGDGGPVDPPVEYMFVQITDTSADENTNGTPGVDICGVSADCGGAPLTGINGTLTQGTGTICEAIDPAADCSAPRNDANASLDDGSACDPASAPVSDYVSVGMGGMLWIEFEQDLQGCSLDIIEHSGSNAEVYEVRVCTAADEVDCLLADGTPLGTATAGGEISVDVPAAE